MQEEEHCCKLSVFIHLHQAQDCHNIQNDLLLYHLALAGENEINSNSKFF